MSRVQRTAVMYKSRRSRPRPRAGESGFASPLAALADFHIQSCIGHHLIGALKPCHIAQFRPQDRHHLAPKFWHTPHPFSPAVSSQEVIDFLFAWRQVRSRFAKGGFAFVRRIFQHIPGGLVIPVNCADSRAYAGLGEMATHVIDCAVVLADPGKLLLHDMCCVKDDVKACFSTTLLLLHATALIHE